MSPNPVFPPLDGSLLFHEVVNFNMQNNPELPMFAYVDDQSSDHNVTEITFLEFGRAAHRVARSLRPGVREGGEGEIVMLIANCDTILFHAVVVGMIIAGQVPFLVSPRNSSAAVVDMMKKTNCSRIVTLRHAHGDLIEDIRKEMPDRELVVDELSTLSCAFPKLGREVEADPFVPYPAPALRPDLDSPVLYFHSSGSTGFPKPILHTHRVQSTWLTQPMMHDLHRLPGLGRNGAMALPPFHAFGLGVQVYVPLCSLVTACVYAPRAVTDPYAPPVVPTTDNMLNCLRWTGCNIVMTVPTFLEQWARSKEDVEELKKFDLIMYGGGPLPEKIGDELVAAGVAISTGYGGTEFGCPAHLRFREDIEDGDWSWIRLSDNVKIRWVPYGDDRYECQVLSNEKIPVAVENIPDVRGYATSDLFIKHPTRNLWKIVGRADDVIILASGEKTVPAPMESLINSSPLVHGSIMFGRERNQVGILVQPQPDHVVDVRDNDAVAEFRNKIWPLVEEANKTAPAFSRIFKDMILITNPEKPLLRTPKDSVRRNATIEAYGTEIDALYEAVEANEFAGPSAWNMTVLEGWLMEHANAISRGHSVNPSADLFAQGFDSLSVTYLRNQLVSALRASPDAKTRSAVSRISPNIIFENPTIERLAAQIADIVLDGEVSEKLDPKELHVTAINAMIEKYSSGLTGLPASETGALQNGTVPTRREVVLLTGSTGGLGSFLLAQLLDNPGVERVYALNRPSSISSAKRQGSSFVDKGISVDLLEPDKLVYIESDASEEKCGLSPALYEELCRTVTTIIHNAWRLDFNLSLASFEPNIKATRNLVDLALSARHSNSIRFLFTSSIGSAQSWDHQMGSFPEEVQPDPSWAVGSGYGEAKYVSERIIVKSGLRATSLRIGQISGGPNGSWATTDWIPIIVKSSITLGAFPDSHGVVSWMRADDVAASVLDVAFAEDAPQVLNIVNPRRTSWTGIMSSIRDAVLLKLKASSTSGDRLTMISLADWVVLLEKKADGATQEDLVDIPAIKLLEFFRVMARHEEMVQMEARLKGSVYVGEAGGVVDFRTERAQNVSKTVAGMQPVGDADAHAWVDYWSSAGLF